MVDCGDVGYSWWAQPNGNYVLPEYLPAVAQMCIHPSVMGSSPVADIILKLREISADPKKSRLPSSVDLYAALIQKAYGLRSIAQAQSFSGLSTIQDGDGQAIYTAFYDDMKLYSSSMSWEKPVLDQALSVLMSEEDADGLKIIIGLVCRGARECNARKRYVFCAILRRIPVRTVKTFIPSVSASSEIESSISRLYEASVDYINDVKDRAVSSTFLQPVLLYCKFFQVDVAMDADVHGVSTFLAMLQAATGIRTNRIPTYEDEAKGTVHFLNANMNAEVTQAMWSNDNLGKAFSAIPVCRECKRPFARQVQPHQFIWDKFESVLEEEQASKCVDSSSENAILRRQFAPYVQQFASYFTHENILPRLFQTLTVGDDGISKTLLDDLNVVFRSMRPEENAECDDVRHFVWDEDANAFDLTRLKLLFDRIGVTYKFSSKNIIALDVKPKPQIAAVPRLAGNPVPRNLISLTVAGDIRGGGTGREFATNLLNDGREPWNKWVHPGTSRSFAKMDFSKPQIIRRYGLCSANDFPGRDPATWEFSGYRTDKKQWQVLHTVDRCPFTSRWQWIWYTLEQPVLVSSVRLYISSTRTRADALQLGHFHVET